MHLLYADLSLFKTPLLKEDHKVRKLQMLKLRLHAFSTAFIIINQI